MALTVGELVAFLDLDANPFTKGLNQAMADGEKAGKRMSDVGGKLTKNVTVPLIAAGGAAVKLGTDFDTAFSRMVGLAGVPAAEVDGLKDSVLDLAGETAVAPQQLADALYFAASAGLDAAGAMDAVTYAAKASASGMGQAEQVVGLVASAVASYGQENINAAQATDILTAAVRAGRADPEELAGTLGRILPVAAQLGITFEEVGGTVAYLSNVFGDTNRTVTAISGLFVKLVSPTQQGRDALEDMGTSVEELQAAIDQDGLMGALDLLREKGFAGNQQALRALFDDIEGYQAALALLNDRSGDLAGTLDEVAGSAGALDEAFNAASDTDGFKMKQALVDLQTAAIEAGDVIAPFVATVVGGTADVASAFASLPGPAQTVVLAFAGILAAVGPLTSIGGKLLSNWKQISSAFETVALKGMYLKDSINNIGIGKVGAIAGGAAAAGVGIFALAMFKASERAERLRAAARELADEAEATGDTLEDVALRKLVKTFAESDRTAKSMERLGLSFADLRGPLQGSEADFKAWRDALFETDEATNGVNHNASQLASRVGQLRDELGEAQQVTTRTAQAQEELGIQTSTTAGASDAFTGSLDELTSSLEDQSSAADKAAEALDGLLEATMAQFNSDIAYQRAINNVEDALAKVNDTAADGESTAEDLERATLDAKDALLGQADAAVRLKQDQANANGEVYTAEQKAAAYKEELYRLAGSMEPGSPLRVALEGYMGDLNAIPESVATKLLVDAGGAFQTVREFLNYLDAIGTRSPSGHTVLLGFKQDQLLQRASGGFTPGGRDVLVGEEGPEIVRFGSDAHVFNAATTARMLDGGTTFRSGGSSGGGGSVVVEIPIVLDGRRIGRSKAVIEGMDTVRARRDRNTAGAA